LELSPGDAAGRRFLAGLLSALFLFCLWKPFETGGKELDRLGSGFQFLLSAGEGIFTRG
jgi:hypothetical protein